MCSWKRLKRLEPRHSRAIPVTVETDAGTLGSGSLPYSAIVCHDSRNKLMAGGTVDVDTL